MTKPQLKTVEPVNNHKEAYELALIKRDESNLARCYLELIEYLDSMKIKHLGNVT